MLVLPVNNEQAHAELQQIIVWFIFMLKIVTSTETILRQLRKLTK
jgi:hypothetical protein